MRIAVIMRYLCFYVLLISVGRKSTPQRKTDMSVLINITKKSISILENIYKRAALIFSADSLIAASADGIEAVILIKP